MDQAPLRDRWQLLIARETGLVSRPRSWPGRSDVITPSPGARPRGPCVTPARGRGCEGHRSEPGRQGSRGPGTRINRTGAAATGGVRGGACPVFSIRVPGPGRSVPRREDSAAALESGYRARQAARGRAGYGAGGLRGRRWWQGPVHGGLSAESPSGAVRLVAAGRVGPPCPGGRPGGRRAPRRSRARRAHPPPVLARRLGASTAA